MLELVVGNAIFLALMAGIFVPLEGWFPRAESRMGARAVLLCVGLLFADVVAMEAVGGWILDSLASLRSPAVDASGWRIAAVLVLAEVAGYWAHRMMHRARWLWRFHALHHAPATIHWLDAWRQHPVDFVIHGVIVGLPGALLGASLADVGAVVLLRKTYTTFLHANLGWSLRWMEGWIATPSFHAIHHSQDPRDHDRNFAGMVPALDRIFGTLARQGAGR